MMRQIAKVTAVAFALACLSGTAWAGDPDKHDDMGSKAGASDAGGGLMQSILTPQDDSVAISKAPSNEYTEMLYKLDKVVPGSINKKI